MTPIQPTTSITIDGEVFEVSIMSEEVQQMVQYLDDWRQDEVDQASDLLKTRAALRDIQNTLLQQIQTEKTEAEAEDVAESEEEAREVEAELVTE